MMNKLLKSIFVAIIPFFTIVLFSVFFSNHNIYCSFNNEYGLYHYYKNERVKIYYKSECSKEFLKVFTTNVQGAIDIYEKLHDFNKGRTYSIAEVDQTCGTCCGRIGFPGIEIQTGKFLKIYNSYTKYKKFDSLVFYELGRNFWFYDDQLTCSESGISNAMRTGFAVFMRNICVDKLSIDADSINYISYNQYLKDLKSIFYYYSADTTLNIDKVLIDDILPEISSDLEVTGSNFWASLLFFLYDQKGFGDDWLNRIWSDISKKPESQNENDILKNFFSACNPASEETIENLFENSIKWTGR